MKYRLSLENVNDNGWWLLKYTNQDTKQGSRQFIRFDDNVPDGLTQQHMRYVYNVLVNALNAMEEKE